MPALKRQFNLLLPPLDTAVVSRFFDTVGRAFCTVERVVQLSDLESSFEHNSACVSKEQYGQHDPKLNLNQFSAHAEILSGA